MPRSPVTVTGHTPHIITPHATRRTHTPQQNAKSDRFRSKHISSRRPLFGTHIGCCARVENSWEPPSFQIHCHLHQVCVTGQIGRTPQPDHVVRALMRPTPNIYCTGSRIEAYTQRPPSNVAKPTAPMYCRITSPFGCTSTRTWHKMEFLPFASTSMTR